MLHYQNKSYLNFCSNDYLGLASHPAVIAALKTGAEHYGVGSGASQLITGHCAAHAELEQAFAEFMGYERALLFGSSMLANLGVITALMKRGDMVFADKWNHASLIDAVRLSGATHKRYQHADMAQLTNDLGQSAIKHKFIISDGVFSMSGDIAPIPHLVQSATMHQALLMIDDAHGVGVLGKQGRGILEHFNLTAHDVSVLVCPLGKAMGGYGAIVLGNTTIIENLIQFARSFIYTTALPPALAVAMLQSLCLLQQETWRREKLQALVTYFKQGAIERGLSVLPSNTPIQSLLIGSAENTNQISQALQQQGIMISAIRPPTVPENTARLRITFNCLHEISQIEHLLDALKAINH